MAMPRWTVRWESMPRKVSLPCRASRGVVCMFASALAAAAGGPPSATPTVPDDRVVSAGRWNVTSVEWEGRAVDEEWLARLQVIYRPDGSWAVLLKRLPVAEGKSTHRQDVSPKTFEMETLGSEAIEPSRYTGIYRLEGDTRVLCIVRAGSPRPNDFSATKNSGRMLVTLTRSPEPPPRQQETRR